MRDCFEKILQEYNVIYKNNDKEARKSFSKVITKDAVEKVREGIFLDKEFYLVEGSTGQGRMAQIPWVSIRDKRISLSAKVGIYVVYLFAPNGKVILALGQAIEDADYKNQENKIMEFLNNVNNGVNDKIGLFVRNDNVKLRLGENLTTRAKDYEKCAKLYKEYKKGELPSNEIFKEDLNKMLEIYKAYVQSISLKEVNLDDNNTLQNIDMFETIKNIKSFIAAKGFKYEDGIIENFYLSLKSKPFVLLAGTSGTGKTRLAKLFAEAIGATSENGRYKMVPVRPDWSDSSDLLGHIDLNGNFVPGAIYDFAKSAMDNKEKPYFLCLDEMNLARVEYYFSDFLSIIETRDMDSNGNISSEVLYSNKALSESEKLNLPENLYIIGTVNMDETTFPFSRKVLDRANTIEFSYVDLNVDTLESFGETNQLDLDNKFLKSKYLLLAHCKDELDYVRTRADELQKINEILQKADAHIGYRVRDEIIFYLLNNKEAKLIDENEAFDNELMQKILPRIQGSSEVIKNMLCNLFEVCFNEPSKVQTESDNTFELMYKQCEAEDCKYKHSARKIAFMVRRFEEDGFTSYWL